MAKEPESKPAAKKSGPIEVRATARGHFGVLREPGDIFNIDDESQMGSWMEKMSDVRAQKAARRKAQEAADAE